MMLPVEDAANNILKRDVVTRWTSTLEMLKSFIGKSSCVNIWLTYLNKPELHILSDEEEFLPNLVQFFETCGKVTKILENNSSTLNLALVMFVDIREELEAQNLSVVDSDSVLDAELKRMYNLTLMNLEKRYPISDEMICASLLDPTFQSLPIIKTLLAERNLTKQQFLKNMFTKYVGELPNVSQGSGLTKSNSIREKLATKHGLVSHSVGFQREVSSFETVTHQVDDLLQWYECVGIVQFPLLSQLARTILQLSATSATIERLNSRAGRVITFERTNLSNTKVNKLMIVQYNYPVLKKCLKLNES